MSQTDLTKAIAVYIKQNQCVLDHNHSLFDIFEGNLLPYILCDLEKQLSPQSFEQARMRAAPINILKRMIDKLSRIYTNPPTRTLVGNVTETDQALFKAYLELFNMNVQMGIANEFFNLFKNTALDPYLDDYGNPKLRIIPSDRYLVYSVSERDPTYPTHFIKCMGKQSYDVSGKEKEIYGVYSDEEYWVQDSEGNIVSMGDIPGVIPNEYGEIPQQYINRSLHSLIPSPDTDTLAMTKLIPILLTDLNFAVMFQCFSLVYGIDLDFANVSMSPNAILDLKSNPASGKEPKLGTIKPEADSQKVIELVQTELSMWLQSRSIRPGATGKLTSETFTSGISKMVDEMDTSEDREKQVSYFKEAEEKFWFKMFHNIHPVWAANPDYILKGQFSPGLRIEVEFSEQRPELSRVDLINVIKEELALGLTTKSRAIAELNPDYDDAQVAELLGQINAENTVVITMPAEGA